MCRKNIKQRSSTFPFKKGNLIADGATALVVLIALAFVFIIMNYVGDDLNTDIQADEDINNASKQRFDTTMTTMPALFDDIFVFVLAGIWLAILIASFFIDSHPIFFVIMLIAMVMMLGGVMLLSNAYEETVTDDDLVTYTNSYPKMHYIMTHLVETLIILFSTVLIALYGKSRFYD